MIGNVPPAGFHRFNPGRYYIVVHRLMTPPEHPVWRPIWDRARRGRYVKLHIDIEDAQEQLKDAAETFSPDTVAIAKLVPEGIEVQSPATSGQLSVEGLTAETTDPSPKVTSSTDNRQLTTAKPQPAPSSGTPEGVLHPDKEQP